MRFLRIACLVACTLAGWAACGSAWAEPEAAPLPEIAALRVGFNGHYKAGVWTPVEVTLRGSGVEAMGRVSLTVPDGEGVASRVSTPVDRPCRVGPDDEVHVLFYARYGRVDNTTTVRFETSDGRTVERHFHSSDETSPNSYPPAIGADRRLAVCIGDEEVGIEEAASTVTHNTAKRPVAARLDDASQLPDKWYGYEGVDVVLVTTSRPKIYRKGMKVDGPRQKALDRWIRLGGRLVITAGVGGEKASADDSPLAQFIPGQWKAGTPLRRLSALEHFVDSARPIPSTGSLSQRIPASQLETVEQNVLARESNVPLIVRVARGFGQVTFLAVDLDKAPLNQWNDRGSLVASLLGWPKLADEDRNKTTAATHLGFTDISGQLRSALDRFTGVTLVPFGAVVGVIVLYLLLIGPGDYGLLQRLKRLGWTWITFPTLIVIFSVGAFVAAFWLKGNELRINQVDLVDVDAQSSLVRGTHWSNLYSPRADTYNLSLKPNMPKSITTENRLPIFAWLGLPGSGLGGMDAKTVNPNQWRSAYDFAPSLDRIEGLPMQTWSTRSFTGRWHARWGDEIPAKLIRREDVPVGRLANPLDVELKNCWFIYDRWVYVLGNLGPNESIPMSSLPERSELRTLLTGFHKVYDARTDRMEHSIELYDAESVNRFHILRTMMFFEKAGGQRYTNLSDEYQAFVDLSHLLGPNRAMLVGIAEKSAATLCRDEQPLESDPEHRLTVYRFVFPVEEPQSP